jgi:hypothetical protein
MDERMEIMWSGMKNEVLSLGRYSGKSRNPGTTAPAPAFNRVMEFSFPFNGSAVIQKYELLWRPRRIFKNMTSRLNRFQNDLFPGAHIRSCQREENFDMVAPHAMEKIARV